MLTMQKQHTHITSGGAHGIQLTSSSILLYLSCSSTYLCNSESLSVSLYTTGIQSMSKYKYWVGRYNGTLIKIPYLQLTSALFILYINYIYVCVYMVSAWT